MFNGAIEFDSLEDLKFYCVEKRLQFIEDKGFSIKGRIYNENKAEVGIVYDAKSASFKNLKPNTKWIIAWT